MDELTRCLLAARDGDRGAFTTVIQRSQADVWRLAAHLVAPDEADDITQDVFVRAYRSLPRFRADASARTWLLSIARNACADAIRSRRRRRRLHTRLEQSTTDTVVPGPEPRTELDALLASLTPDRRVALTLTQVLGCSYFEAAEVCGVPVGTIRSRVARARADLIALVRAAETA